MEATPHRQMAQQVAVKRHMKPSVENTTGGPKITWEKECIVAHNRPRYISMIEA